MAMKATLIKIFIVHCFPIISGLDRENSVSQHTSHKDRKAQLHYHPSRRKDQTYTKRRRAKLLQGSLENVSCNPLGEHRPSESTLRRSRSLAISREDVFTNLEIAHGGRTRRRSQLIPRAKLIDRCNNSSSRNSLHRGVSHESLYGDQSCALTRPTEYAAPQQLPGFKYRDDVSGSQYLPNLAHLRHSTTEIDSLEHDSGDYKPQPQHHPSTHRQLTEDSGLSLPHYYPDSKCDTDHSFTDTVSVGKFGLDAKYRRCSLYPSEDSTNISYDENIVLTKNTLYDKVDEHYMQSKPRRLRGNTPYYAHDQETYVKPRSLPSFAPNLAANANGYESDSTLSDYDPKYYEPVEKTSSDSNTNEQIVAPEAPIVQQLQPEKSDPVYGRASPQQADVESKSEFSNIEANPIYDEIPVSAADKELNKTSIQVPPEPEEFKTVVSVPEDLKPTTSDEEDVKEAKKHSHNYLKEFLETQKGSKKPLQNFLSKRISRAFNSSNESVTTSSSQEKKSNLSENQYFSLPDITASKNLQKCERIDRKLRKCENLSKSPSDASTNRFIVNIGNHFDVTASASIPVDFELKISKIPKLKKPSKSDKAFADAVKHLNATLKGEAKPKLIVNGQEINTADLHQRDKEVEVLIEDTKMAKSSEMANKEFQDKINTMRTYWGGMVSQKEQREEKHDAVKAETSQTISKKCKIVGVQTKIDDAKKRMDEVKEDYVKSEDYDRIASKVQITKQFFENNDAQLQKGPSKQGIAETPHLDNAYESLNPNTVEIIERNAVAPNQSSPATNLQNRPKLAIPDEARIGKPTEPEFDHVRYRVVKSDLFQKKIFAKCSKESQFDGLMQYLQDYSFQELLYDNNIVIIEPIRTNIQYVGGKHGHNNEVTKFIRTPGKPPASNETSGLRKHFFYHPIRVNREVNDDELPNPDTVKQVRQLFEARQMSRSQSSKALDSITKQTVQYIRPVDPDKDRCSASDGSSNLSEYDAEFYDEENDMCCEYVSEDILEKIRECGTSVTYYGGRMTSKRKPQAMTKAIMDEIQTQNHSNNSKPKCSCNCKRKLQPQNRPSKSDHKATDHPGSYQGVKFKLLKSNSCSSRLELVGTKNLSEYRKKFITKQKQLLDEHNKKKQLQTVSEKNHINEAMNALNQRHTPVGAHNKVNSVTAILNNINGRAAPKIIGEEVKAKKLIQWGEMRDSNKTYAGITYTSTLHKAKSHYDFNHYDKLKLKPTSKNEEMEFEPYEVAN